jgi:hypothetical protein
MLKIDVNANIKICMKTSSVMAYGLEQWNTQLLLIGDPTYTERT